MSISKKCIYALRAIFELSLRGGSEPVKINKIADAQDIPPRFLEVILNQLKHAGYVDSRRGKEGGYILSYNPQDLTVSKIIEAVQGPIGKKTGKELKTGKQSPRRGDYAFTQMWESARKAVSSIYGNTSFSDLIELDKAGRQPCIVNYAI
jgi:Rrf2 family protein